MDWGAFFARGRRDADAHSVEDTSDWRLTNQSDYLQGRELRWADWSAPRPEWDHDHCSFCWTEIAVVATEHAPLTAAYVTADDAYHWICAECFDDFHESFEWTVVDGGERPHG